MLLLTFPAIQAITKILPESEIKNENCALATMPTLSMENINEFPEQFEKYYNDHFPLRGVFLSISHNVKLALGISPSTSTIIGKSKFMYASYYKNTYTSKPKDKNVAQRYAQILRERKDSLQAMGIEFYVILVPTSFQIYPEYLPKHIIRADTTLADFVCQAMHEYAPDVHFVYPKKELLHNKTWGQLYRKYDTHWNSKGGYIGAQEILTLMQKDFPNLHILKKEDYNFKYKLQTKGDLIDPLLIKNSSIGPLFNDRTSPDTLYSISCKDTTNNIRKGVSRNYPVPEKFAYTYESEYVTNKKDAPKLFVIRDSYWSYLVDFICPHFRETICIWDKWQYATNYDLISKEKPDIVLLEMFEPQIVSLVNHEESLQDSSNVQ